MTLENEDIYGNEAPIHPKYDPKFQQHSGFNPTPSIEPSVLNKQFFLAAKNGNLENMRLLLDAGAEVDSEDKW